MNYFKHKIMMLAALALLLLGGSGCSEDGYVDIAGTESQTLWEVIQTRPELSQFAALLQAGDYDDLLGSSGNYTVLAPVNSYLEQLSSEELASVPGSQIALFGYNSTALAARKYLTMLNEKQLVLAAQNLTEEEIVCRNGFLRFASPDGNLYQPAQPNIYERLQLLADEYDMARFIVSLGDSVMDPEASVQIGIDEQTNLPIYDTVRVYHNPLFEYVPLHDNDSLMSLVLVDNATWARMQARYWPYMKQNNGRFDNQDAAGYSTTMLGALDSAATDSIVRTELVKDLTCYLEGATIRPSVRKATRQVYTSMSGIELTMDSATIIETIPASNGEIQVAKDVRIHLYNNKIRDLYVEGEDYYYSNENYKATLVDARFRGSRYVKTYGVDSLRMYDRYVVGFDTTYKADGTIETIRAYKLKGMNGSDSIQHVGASTRYVYSTSQFATAWGGSVYGYKAQLYSCDYKIQWRHVVPATQGSNYCNPDTNCVNYEKYLENPNYPCGGVVRHIQKMYLSQPGERPLEYNSSTGMADFVLNSTSNNPYSNTYKGYRCLTDYDPEAIISNGVDDEVGNGNGSSRIPPVSWKRMGINAGVGIDDPTFETPLIWCRTQTPNQTDIFLSGISGIHQSLSNNSNKTTGKPIIIPRDIFRSFYAGEATVFVTSNPFGVANARSAYSNFYGSIFLDYIHFIPNIGEDE